MLKSDLKSGMLVTNRQGNTFFVVAGAWGGKTGLLSHKECDMLDSYSEDLTFGYNRIGGEHPNDIVEVWDSDGGWGLGIKSNLEDKRHFGRTLLWQRHEVPVAEESTELFGG